ncbi:hypothetical protein DSM106972_015920 [Dulcicalothrix desertica PCC 7102]|uniref:Uncharacterized protein n=1 Tax=Dulcicalothrix desertica PCC 7102 TaxID=232991 RepID=A0A433VQP7_9CYAN|nr:hypothetical protein [Dulcicalothrix desertica]RUT08424.1 hypothetical protein DSM106972_015920 [Dulcicalothrix desertica PCC 7102]TWH40289.1 hypothetical protein CAL7102_09596 [Dulcicalothrix desertica PCC 7102]
MSNDVELLQNFFRLQVNKEVRKFFKDVTADDDLTTPRGLAKNLCLHKDVDTSELSIMRLFAYYIICGAFEGRPVYGIPTTSFQEQRKFKPQVQLYFQEDLGDVDAGYSPVTGEISFRLMNQETTTLSKAEATSYANKIKTAFAKPSFVWKKGKELYSYTDWAKGYQLQLLCRNESEARRVVEQVLDIQSHSPEWKRLRKNEAVDSAATYPTIPGNQTILGKSQKKPRQRPIADVRFQYALLHVHGLPRAITLVDRTGTFANPLVTL